jgi:tripartite-type tricarboxylate transporter receptor subunit TctC
MAIRFLTATGMIVLGLAVPVAAQDVAEFYRGKQVRLMVGSAVGGGYDTLGRLLARHIVNHIPGNPTVIVQNLPAAGGMVMTNQLYSQGPRDGTVIGAPINGIPTAPMLQAGAQFDASKLNWIGSLMREASLAFIWHTVPVSHVTELASKEVLIGTTTVSTTMYDFPLLLNDLLGYKFKLVRGYRGTPEIYIAIERGEIQGNGGMGLASLKAVVPKWIEEKKIKFLVQYNFQPHPEFAGVPMALDLARTEAERQAMRLAFSRLEYARPYFLPPGVPPERVQALRRAFDATMKDPAFLADAAKVQLELSPMPGEEMQALVGELAGTPAAVVERVRKALLAPTAVAQ